ncbi:MAG: alpha/beta hydrolase [Pseudomonadota bacterium]
MLTTHFVQNGDIQTAYYDLGNTEKPPLLLVHGFTGSKLDFLNQGGWLVEDARIIIPDQRGHGETSNTLPYTFDQLTTDLLNLLDALALPSCHLLGHSMGGMVALRAALSAPERFRSLILMDTAPHGLSLMPREQQAVINRLVEDGGCQALVKGMRVQAPSRSVQRGIDFLGEAEHWRRIEVKLQQMDPTAFTSFAEAIREQTAVTDQLDQMSLPTTILVGTEDQPFLAPSQLMQQHIADSVLIEIPQAAHSPQYENADAWRDAVLAHLQRCA